MHSFIVVLHLVQKAVFGRELFFDRYEGLATVGLYKMPAPMGEECGHRHVCTEVPGCESTSKG